MSLRLLPLLLLFWATLGIAQPRNPDAHFFTQTFGDLKAELNTAREEGKKGVLVMFEMEGCPYCRKMRETVLNQPEVQDWYRKHFVIFSINVWGETPLVDFSGANLLEKQFAARFNVKYTPVFQFFDLDGKPTAGFNGAPKGGAKEFMELGRYVADGAYKNGGFAEYRKHHPGK